MANEIYNTVSLTGTKGVQDARFTISERVTLTGKGLHNNRQAVGLAAEAIVIPADLGSEGIKLLAFYNDDATNFVDISLNADGSSPFMRIPAKKWAAFPPYTSNPTYYGKADTAGIDLIIYAQGT